MAEKSVREQQQERDLEARVTKLEKNNTGCLSSLLIVIWAVIITLLVLSQHGVLEAMLKTAK